MEAVRHLGFVMCVFEPLMKIYLVVFITVQNLVGTWNRRSSFDNTQVLIFCELRLGMPIYAHKCGTILILLQLANCSFVDLVVEIQ